MKGEYFEYQVIDSAGECHSLEAGHSAIEDGYVCFFDFYSGLMVHSFFQPISSECTGKYHEKA